MSINIPNHFVQQYSTNIQMLLQQKDSRFSSAVMSGTHVGKQASPVNQFGAIDMLPVNSRFEPIGRVDATADRRWVYPSDWDLPQMIDSFDELRLLTDPKSAYVQSAFAAANRRKDITVNSAFFGTSQTGETGATATTFGTTVSTSGGQNIAVAFGAAAAAGLTVAKLIEAKTVLMQAEVEIESDPLYCAVTARQHANLLNEIQIVSTEYNNRPVLVDGRIQSWLGINFIHSERLTTGTDDAAGTSRQVPMWAKSGMYLGMWNDITSDISQRKDLKGLPWQAYVYMTLGATRLEEKKVVRVWCRE